MFEAGVKALATTAGHAVQVTVAGAVYCYPKLLVNRIVREPPLSLEGYTALEPVYEEMPGWRESTVG